MEHKLEFAQRLREAMVAEGLAPRPGVLLNLFNANYWGRSVSFQAVSRWLRGEAIPAQDKLLVLAEALKVEPEVLRFGEAVRHRVREHRARWDAGVGYQEREVFDAFLRLPAPQRKLVREVIQALAQVQAERKA
ncbi:helix-turn-helix domain-containing protein [Hydrogenophaga sp.]|uniref:helix-turn-helix domain-containing protein n=1 Tax=Hydrogenophaga sp. TaxID=1904254 RepID=UPI003D1191A1